MNVPLTIGACLSFLGFAAISEVARADPPSLTPTGDAYGGSLFSVPGAGPSSLFYLAPNDPALPGNLANAAGTASNSGIFGFHFHGGNSGRFVLPNGTTLTGDDTGAMLRSQADLVPGVRTQCGLINVAGCSTGLSIGDATSVATQVERAFGVPALAPLGDQTTGGEVVLRTRDPWFWQRTERMLKSGSATVVDYLDQKGGKIDAKIGPNGFSHTIVFGNGQHGLLFEKEAAELLAGNPSARVKAMYADNAPGLLDRLKAGAATAVATAKATTGQRVVMYGSSLASNLVPGFNEVVTYGPAAAPFAGYYGSQAMKLGARAAAGVGLGGAAIGTAAIIAGVVIVKGSNDTVAAIEKLDKDNSKGPLFLKHGEFEYRKKMLEKYDPSAAAKYAWNNEKAWFDFKKRLSYDGVQALAMGDDLDNAKGHYLPCP